MKPMKRIFVLATSTVALCINIAKPMPKNTYPVEVGYTHTSMVVSHHTTDNSIVSCHVGGQWYKTSYETCLHVMGMWERGE